MTTPYLPPSRIYQNHQLDSTRWQAFAPRDDDIIISTSYKSGTTWLIAIVRELIVHAMRQAGISDQAQFPGPDTASTFWVDNCFGNDSVDDLQAKLEAQPHRRFLKSHLALDGLPIYPQVKYLVVARDPRDVFMSFWNHYAAFTDLMYSRMNDRPDRQGAPLPPCPADIHTLWAMWIGRGWFEWEQEGYPFWGNMHHIQSWWNYRHLDNLLFLHYADMLADPEDEIQRIADFLAIEICAETLMQIVQETSLGAMRQRAMAGEGEIGMQKVFRGGNRAFFNQGTNGRWQGVLTEAELKLYERTRDKVLTPDCARWLELGRVGLG